MKKTLTVLLVVVLAATLLLTGCKGKSTVIEGNYTYNDYMAGSPQTWNNHTWDTNDDQYILTQQEMGLYTYYINDSKDGYTVVPEMASDMAEDVTKKYAGDSKYGVPADATAGYAWKIKLNKDAVWQDGTKINADTYIYSMQQLLNPQMMNRRADSYYAGELVIANAKNYLYSGKSSYSSWSDSFASAEEAIAAGKELFIDAKSFWGVTAADGSAYVSITDETKIRDEAVELGKDGDYVSGAMLWGMLKAGGVYESYSSTYVMVKSEVPVTPWENVGLVKTGEYEITLVLQKPITREFYVYYNLSGNWIVKEDLYEKCKSQSGDLIVSTYCTSVDTTIGYGPYKLTEFQADKQFTLERNDKWYGYTDGKHEGKYMTSKIVCQVVEKQATALQMFVSGELDTVGLTAADMNTYRFSDSILYTPQDYTTKITFNTDKAALKARSSTTVNKLMLTYKDFRNAFALSLDRADYAQTQTASHKAGFGILNSMYVYDPDKGSLYRDSEPAKEALVKFYVGADWNTKYKTLDEAYEAMTGYQPEMAKALFNKAYDAAVAAGDFVEGQTVTIEFAVYKNDTTYINMFNWFKASIESAVKGTKFEGKVTMTMAVDDDYYNSMKAGKLDMITSTWGGAAFAPFSMISNVYVDDTNRHEYGFSSSVSNAIEITLDINGESKTMGLKDWADSLAGVAGAPADYSNADYDTMCKILAACEYELLNYGAMTPVYYRYVASLKSLKVAFPVEEYLQIVGYGGIPEMTYNYTDEEWAAYVAQNNKNLPYAG